VLRLGERAAQRAIEGAARYTTKPADAKIFFALFFKAFLAFRRNMLRHW
jgi:hypothetical protein